MEAVPGGFRLRVFFNGCRHRFRWLGWFLIEKRCCNITPSEERGHNFVSLRRKKFEKFSFVNGLTSEAVELYSMPLEHKLYVGEGIRKILHAIASIYLSKNIFGQLFGDKLVIFLYKSKNPLFFHLQRKS